MSNEKLKPCPFCGEAPERVGELYCWCMNSRCIMYCFDITIELWNRRATLPGAVRGTVQPSLFDAFRNGDIDVLEVASERLYGISLFIVEIRPEIPEADLDRESGEGE